MVVSSEAGGYITSPCPLLFFQFTILIFIASIIIFVFDRPHYATSLAPELAQCLLRALLLVDILPRITHKSRTLKIPLLHQTMLLSSF
jgi:hypothetical protein